MQFLNQTKSHIHDHDKMNHKKTFKLHTNEKPSKSSDTEVLFSVNYFFFPKNPVFLDILDCQWKVLLHKDNIMLMFAAKICMQGRFGSSEFLMCTFSSRYR